MTRSIRTALIVVGLILLVAGALWVNRPSFKRPALNVGDFDIIGMLKEVEKNNSAIRKANEELITSLEGVKEQAAAVGGVHARLQKLETGLGDQAAVLVRLGGLTREQADLSAQLQKLTAGVVPSTERLAATAAQQATAIESMQKSTAALVGRMQNIGSINSSINNKMWAAERLSGEVLDLLP